MVRRTGRVDTRTTVLVLAGATTVFTAASAVVIRREPPSWELDLTEWINDAPRWFARAIWPWMQLGSAWAPIIIAIPTATAFGRRRGVAVLVSGVSAWFLAKLVKSIVDRGRPLEFLPGIHVREGDGHGLGFVSGHTAVAFAVATALAPALPRGGRVVAYVLASGVGVARIVYGVHLPLDVIGGAALGVMVGSAIELVLQATMRTRVT